MLDPKKHKDVSVITSHGAEFGEAVNCIPLLGNELNLAFLEYPICFIKSPETGQFILCALVGFDAEENLFLEERKWCANYIPLHIRRQPFLVAYVETLIDGIPQKEMRIAMDAASRRLCHSNDVARERLFNLDGSCTEYLGRITRVLETIISGTESTHYFMLKISELGLIESVKIDIALANGEHKAYEGIYTINAAALKELANDDLIELQRRGYLQACAYIIDSRKEFKKLVDWKRSRFNA